MRAEVKNEITQTLLKSSCDFAPVLPTAANLVFFNLPSLSLKLRDLPYSNYSANLFYSDFFLDLSSCADLLSYMGRVYRSTASISVD